MSVDKTTVARIAHLARIAVAEENLEPLAGELNNLLDWGEQLAEVQPDNIAPMTSVVDMILPRRADKVSDGGYADKVVGNAARTEHGFFVVPKVLE